MNHCWTLFGTTARLALAIGLNRTRHADMTNGCPPIELECRRRTFWNAYCLDNYLSVALGRPRIFHDDDIDQELPSCIDDSNIHVDHVTASTGNGLPLMSAPVAYIRYVQCKSHSTLLLFSFTTVCVDIIFHRLSRIVSTILRDLYSIRPPSTANRCAFAAEHSKSLKAWRAEMSSFLDGQSINTAMLIAIFRRQRNVLNLAYWHTMILIHRPFLMSNFAKLHYTSRNNGREDLHRDQIDENIKECLDAAMNIVNIVNDLVQNSMMFQAFWVSVNDPTNIFLEPDGTNPWIVHFILCIFCSRRSICLHNSEGIISRGRLPGILNRRDTMPKSDLQYCGGIFTSRTLLLCS
jgi:hypothetical protein